MAAAYDAGRSLTPAALEAWGAVARPYLRTGDEAPVLDLGAGTGRFSGPLADWSGGMVVAVEPAAAMASQLRARRLADVRVLAGAAESIPLRQGSVKAAWLSQVLHHIGDLDRAAADIGRVVRPGGHVLLRGGFGNHHADSGRSDFVLYRYFPAAMRFADTFPTRGRVLDAFAAAGLLAAVSTTVAQVTASSLRELYDRAATRADSTLAAIDDETFAAGLAALQRDAQAENRPRPVVDRLDFVVLRRAGRQGQALS